MMERMRVMKSVKDEMRKRDLWDFMIAAVVAVVFVVCCLFSNRKA